MKLTSYGGAGAVTGSCHLIDTGGKRILFDCGLHQGHRHEADKQNRSFAFDPKTINAVILSHGHADHCGLIPKLVKEGFRGSIYASNATVDVAKYILLDSAKIQEQDAEYLTGKLPEGSPPLAPLYNTQEVELAMKHFIRVPYFRTSGQWTQLTPELKFKLLDAGHILGSSVIVLESLEEGQVKTLAFSGDLGPARVPLLRDAETITENLDALLFETTYGDRVHATVEIAEQKLIDLIHDAVKSKSKIIVPAFALGRTQELLYVLHKLIDQKKIPRFPIILDSPLATNLSWVFDQHHQEFDQQTWEDFGKRGETPFDSRNISFTHSIEDSKRLNSLAGPCMIIAGSGMCEGGRIRHHLRHNLTNPNSIILFTGYQAQGTLGRKIIEGVNPVNLFGQPVHILAKILKLNELSAHADKNGLLGYLKQIPQIQQLFLVHGEQNSAEHFKDFARTALPHTEILIPQPGETFKIK